MDREELEVQANTILTELVEGLRTQTNLSYEELDNIKKAIRVYGQYQHEIGRQTGAYWAEFNYRPVYDENKTAIEEIAMQTESNYWIYEGGRARLVDLITGALKFVQDKTRAEYESKT